MSSNEKKSAGGTAVLDQQPTSGQEDLEDRIDEMERAAVDVEASALVAVQEGREADAAQHRERLDLIENEVASAKAELAREKARARRHAEAAPLAEARLEEKAARADAARKQLARLSATAVKHGRAVDQAMSKLVAELEALQEVGRQEEALLRDVYGTSLRSRLLRNVAGSVLWELGPTMSAANCEIERPTPPLRRPAEELVAALVSHWVDDEGFGG